MHLLLQPLAEKTGQILKKQNLKLVTAESCTGGGFSFWVTSIPGSSEWFERGFITYSDQAKIEMLGVKEKTLSSFGAVSKETAIEMAEGALKNSHAEISVAITGIAGPTGASKEKPIGTVWIAFAKKNFQTEVFMEIYKGDRETIREKTIAATFEKLLNRIGE